jgi:hypothetical protein
MAFPKKTEKMMTGEMQTIMARVSCQEMMNRKMKATTMKMKERTNIDTFVLSPFWITAVSDPILLTTKSAKSLT